MIIFNLKCTSNHAFEGWFKNKDEFERQISTNMVCCPQCGSDDVIKIPTASRINTHPSKNLSHSTTMSSNVSPQEIKMISEQFTENLNNYIEKNFSYVGEDFPEEARKIHYGESEPKNIYGYADQNDVKNLSEEGITVVNLNAKPSDKNKLN